MKLYLENRPIPAMLLKHCGNRAFVDLLAVHHGITLRDVATLLDRTSPQWLVCTVGKRPRCMNHMVVHRYMSRAPCKARSVGQTVDMGVGMLRKTYLAGGHEALLRILQEKNLESEGQGGQEQ